MKLLKAKKYPDLDFEIENFDIDKIHFIAGESWLHKKMYEYGYYESFKNAGMIYPITVVDSKDYWERVERLPKDDNGDVIEGLYVVTGHKRVLWAKENGYDKIEGYYFNSKEDKRKIHSLQHIEHTEIPK